jgi:hypothetical protein
MALLPAKTLGFDDGQALQANLMQRVLYLIQLEGFYDGLDLFHRSPFHHGVDPMP